MPDEKRCLNCNEVLTWRQQRFCCLSCKTYYNHNKLEEKNCVYCWAQFVWTHKTKYCCYECKVAGKKETAKQTSIEKYWTEHPMQSEQVKNTCIINNVKKYWVAFSWQREDVKNKIKETNVKKYWVEYAQQNKDISRKSIESMTKTCMEKYWVPFPCLTDWCINSSTMISKVNLKFADMLNSYGFSTSLEFNIWGRSYDIKVWNTLIEINPFPFHNSTRTAINSWRRKPISNDYHYNKLKLARDNNYRCIMVRDWDDVEKITYLLDDNKETLYARNCELKQINYEDCHNFFEQYHLQWDTKKDKNNIYVWLYCNNELVECMSFCIPRYNKNYEWEILRLCSHKNYKIVWWANRIFKKFLEITKTNSVISYCDMSKFDWKVYESLWFTLLKWNKPSKHWYNIWEEDSKKHITDNMLRQYGYDKLFNENFWKGTSNDELMKQRGYVEIFDCWQSTFVWQTELSYEIG